MRSRKTCGQVSRVPSLRSVSRNRMTGEPVLWGAGGGLTESGTEEWRTVATLRLWRQGLWRLRLWTQGLWGQGLWGAEAAPQGPQAAVQLPAG